MRTRSTRLPWFAVAFILVTVGLQALTAWKPGSFEVLQRHLALDWQSLGRLEVYRLVTSPFIQTSPGFSRTVIGLTAISVPVAELRIGTPKTMLAFFSGDILSTVPILIILKFMSLGGSATAANLLRVPDSGASSGGFACLGAVSLTLPPRLRSFGWLALFGFLAVRLAYWHRMYDFQHALAAGLGIAIAVTIPKIAAAAPSWLPQAR